MSAYASYILLLVAGRSREVISGLRKNILDIVTSRGTNVGVRVSVEKTVQRLLKKRMNVATPSWVNFKVCT